jgi:uncharacterized protein YcbX
VSESVAFKSPVTVAGLFIYPVKSCAGVALHEAVLTETGLDLDRAWMVVDAHGEFVSQREYPRLALVQPQLKHQDLVLRAPGMLALHLQIDTVQAPVRVRVWDDEVAAYDMGDVAAQWFTDFLSMTDTGLPGAAGEKLRLVRFDPDHRRPSDAAWTQGHASLNAFSDGFPLLVSSEATLADINARLAAAGQEAVSWARFRPNIVLAGLDAYGEDEVDVLTLAADPEEAQLKLVKPCPRCSIPGIDPNTAQPSPAVNQLLESYRRKPQLGGAVALGVNALVLGGLDSVLRVGQAVRLNDVFGN